MRSNTALVSLSILLSSLGCRAEDEHPPDDTTLVGAFEGVHDGAAVGFNFPFEIGIVPDAMVTDEVEGGDIIVADYGTSQILAVENPTERGLGTPAQPFFDGASEGLRGAMGLSVAHYGRVWAAFEQGGRGMPAPSWCWMPTDGW